MLVECRGPDVLASAHMFTHRHRDVHAVLPPASDGRKAPMNARSRQSGRDKRHEQGSGTNANKQATNANERKRNYSSVSVCSTRTCKAAANRVPRLVYTGPPKGMWVFMSGATE